MHVPSSQLHDLLEVGDWQVFPVRAAVPINMAIRATLHFEASGNQFHFLWVLWVGVVIDGAVASSGFVVCFTLE